MPKTTTFLLTDKGVQTVENINGQVVDIDSHEVISEETTQGFNSILRPKKIYYNAKLCEAITGTPYHFWSTAKPEIRQEVISLFTELSDKLKAIRERELKDMYKKRSDRANRAKLAKKQSQE